ncbi:sulfatase family protein [Neolewinella agarilytica]|uniref:sulfatase family protein n=1 Tax=Neolewinella agarilytica TaxID=478744 RepID=UPI002353D312|nr:arylsulfatase [Neolewinella agarilytica]
MPLPKYLILLLFFAPCLLLAQEEDSLPNVVVILADDVGQGDVAAYRRAAGLEVIVETPNLDRLMAEGLHFTDGHSPTSLCAPSRYAVMTGNNPYHSYAPWGVWGAYQKSPLKPTDLTLGKLMQKAGYQTGFLGKWHMGGDFYFQGDSTRIYDGDRSRPQLNVDIRAYAGNGPQDHGFDYSLTFPAGIQNVPYAVYENGKWMPLSKKSRITEITQAKMTPQRVKLDKSEGLGDSHWTPYDMGPLLVLKGIDFIRNAPEDSPFFMYYCSQAVHLPHTPPFSLDGERIRNQTPSYHLDMVKELDVQVGMLVKALKEKGVYEKTFLIFTSDNGGLLRKESLAAGHNSAAPFRGGKNQIFEGGHRVPFMVVWPEKISAGTQSDALVSGTDIIGTLAELTGQQIPAGQANDAYGFLPLLFRENTANKRNYLLQQGGTTKEVIYREGDWKLIMQFDPKTSTVTPKSLFNLTTDPEEQPGSNQIDLPEQKERLTRMLAQYENIRFQKLPTGKQDSPGL